MIFDTENTQELHRNKLPILKAFTIYKAAPYRYEAARILYPLWIGYSIHYFIIQRVYSVIKTHHTASLLLVSFCILRMTISDKVFTSCPGAP